MGFSSKGFTLFFIDELDRFNTQTFVCSLDYLSGKKQHSSLICCGIRFMTPMRMLDEGN